MRRLAQMRKVMGLTQVELAKRLGISEATVTAWERGERFPRSENMRKLMRFFGCTADDLME